MVKCLQRCESPLTVPAERQDCLRGAMTCFSHFRFHSCIKSSVFANSFALGSSLSSASLSADVPLLSYPLLYQVKATRNKKYRIGLSNCNLAESFGF